MGALEREGSLVGAWHGVERVRRAAAAVGIWQECVCKRLTDRRCGVGEELPGQRWGRSGPPRRAA
jgi:hypothetical protein